MDQINKDAWDNLIKRVSKLEERAMIHRDITHKIIGVQESLKRLEAGVGDISKLDVPSVVDGLNTVLDTIRIMQGK